MHPEWRLELELASPEHHWLTALILVKPPMSCVPKLLAFKMLAVVAH